MATPNKLTPQQIKEIRRRYARGEGPAALAGEYGVTRMTIYNQARGVAREKKAKAQLSVVLPQEDREAIQAYARERGMSMSEVVGLAVRGLLALRRG